MTLALRSARVNWRIGASYSFLAIDVRTSNASKQFEICQFRGSLFIQRQSPIDLIEGKRHESKNVATIDVVG